MTKEIFVVSIKGARESSIPMSLFSVRLRNIAKKDVSAFMKASQIMDIIVYDSSFNMIIADAATKALMLKELSSAGQSSFQVLEKNKKILLEN